MGEGAFISCQNTQYGVLAAITKINFGCWSNPALQNDSNIDSDNLSPIGFRIYGFRSKSAPLNAEIDTGLVIILL